MSKNGIEENEVLKKIKIIIDWYKWKSQNIKRFWEKMVHTIIVVKENKIIMF